jgi:4-amino-4-deoxy-L-arabinose transferase-like glycosyltransferase
VSIRNRLVVAHAFVLSLVLSRWPMKPEWLLTFDNANFAFALDDYNPALHKPQPPGYPLFVGLSWLIRLYVENPATVFFIAGLIGTMVTALALARLAEEVEGVAAGIATACLILFHPVIWSAGLMNPVRVFLGAGSAAVGLLAWKSLKPGAHWGWFIGAWAALGVASGFRAVLIALMGPLLLYVGWRRRETALNWVLSACAASLAILAWMSAAAANLGGLGPYVKLLGNYIGEQSENTSLLFGAAFGPAWKMAARAVEWSFIPCLVWMALIPFVNRSELTRIWRSAGMFFLIWIVPPFLFFTLVHSAEPGHVLPIVVPLCFAGGLVLANVRFRAVAVMAATAVAAWMFLEPPNRVMVMSSVRVPRWTEKNVADGLALIRELRSQGPVTVVASPSAPIAWRLLSYYQRQDPVVVLHNDPWPKSDPAIARHWIIREGNLAGQGQGEVPLPENGKVVWFLQKDATLSVTKQRAAGPAIVMDSLPHDAFRVGNFRFVPGGIKTAAAR